MQDQEHSRPQSEGPGQTSAQEAEQKDEITLTPEKQNLLDLIDKAARGDAEAAGEIAEGYFLGKFEPVPNYAKAEKWAHYAAKRGNAKGLFVMNELERLRRSRPS